MHKKHTPCILALLSLCGPVCQADTAATGLSTAEAQPVYTWRLRDQGGAVIREFSSEFNGSTEIFRWKRDYIHGAGRLLASDSNETFGTGLLAYHTDHLGTPRVVSNMANEVQSTHDYLAFGEEVAPSQDGGPLKYTGHERDFLDLDYMRARYYRPSLGRFLSVDPVQDGWNRYNYSANSPLDHRDPTGLSGEKATDSGPTISAYEFDLLDEALDFFLGANSYELQHNLPVELPSGEYERAYLVAFVNLLSWAIPVKAAQANALTKGGTQFAGATAKQSPTVFSHLIPSRYGRELIKKYGEDSLLGQVGKWITGKSTWNGQYVNRSFHALTDPYATVSGVRRGSTTLAEPYNLALRLPAAVQGWLANVVGRHAVDAARSGEQDDDQ